MTPALNKPLPEFEALATGGIRFTPQAYAGKIVVLYFYPKDNTPGCTTEAMQFRDHHKEFVKAGAVVFGVSRDNMASHDKFKQSLELPFELIADTEEKLCHMFGVVKNIFPPDFKRFRHCRMKCRGFSKCSKISVATIPSNFSEIAAEKSPFRSAEMNGTRP